MSLKHETDGKSRGLIALSSSLRERGVTPEGFCNELLGSLSSSALLLGRDERVLFANRNFLEKSEIPGSEIAGKGVSEVLPEAFLRVTRLPARLHKVLSEGIPTQGDRISYRAPGVPTRYLQYRILPVSSETGERLALLLIEDVTDVWRAGEELRQAEQHMASVVESLEDLVISTDPDGKILSWNAAAERFTGFEFEERRHVKFFECCIESQHDDVRELFESLQTEPYSVRVNWQILRKDLPPAPVAWAFSPMRSGRGKRLGVVAVGRDVLDQERRIEQQAQSEKLAALGSFVGRIAHDLGNPLTILSSTLQLLEKGYVRVEERSEHFGACKRSLTRLKLIVESLRQLGPLQQGQEMQPVPLHSVLGPPVAWISSFASGHAVQMLCCFPLETYTVLGDANQLRQAFFTLLFNAIQRMAGVGGMLSVRVEAGGEDAVEIWMCDNGTKLLPIETGHPPDPFTETGFERSGYGLGFSVCWAIIKNHGGRIQLMQDEAWTNALAITLPLVC